MGAIDKFAAMAQGFDRARIIYDDVLHQRHDKLQDHEKRLAAIESRS